VLSTLVLGIFMSIVIHLGSIRPEITLKPEGYNHVYYLYPQTGYFTRRGYGVYVPDSDYTLKYYDGDVAMDFDTSFVLDNNYYIKFDGMVRLLRSESDHLFEIHEIKFVCHIAFFCDIGLYLDLLEWHGLNRENWHGLNRNRWHSLTEMTGII